MSAYLENSLTRAVNNIEAKAPASGVRFHASGNKTGNENYAVSRSAAPPKNFDPRLFVIKRNFIIRTSAFYSIKRIVNIYDGCMDIKLLVASPNCFLLQQGTIGNSVFRSNLAVGKIADDFHFFISHLSCRNSMF